MKAKAQLRGKEALLSRRLFPDQLAPLRAAPLEIDTNTLRDVFELQSQRALTLLRQFNLPHPKGAP